MSLCRVAAVNRLAEHRYSFVVFIGATGHEGCCSFQYLS